jgi:hypothetical protein
VLYFAAPLDLMGASEHRASLRVARRQFPGARIVDPARLFRDSDEWASAWPALLLTLDVLAVLPRLDGSLGWGCWQEITDARKAGLPVWVFSPEAQAFLPLLRMRRLTWPTAAYYARVYTSTGEIAAHVKLFAQQAEGWSWHMTADELHRVWLPAGEDVDADGPPVGGWDHA